jgi:hypothetical protein
VEGDSSSDDWEPEFDEAIAAELIGKYVLVGVSVDDKRGAFKRDEQFHGIVLSCDRRSGIKVALRGSREGQTKTLPPVTNVWQRASKGTYRLRSTGEEVVDPDFTATWQLTQPDS